jgi:hypothetical protein
VQWLRLVISTCRQRSTASQFEAKPTRAKSLAKSFLNQKGRCGDVHLSVQLLTQEDYSLRPSQGKNIHLYLKNNKKKKKKKSWRHHTSGKVPRKHKTLSSNPSTEKKNYF